jgi:hypothetical protein
VYPAENVAVISARHETIRIYAVDLVHVMGATVLPNESSTLASNEYEVMSNGNVIEIDKSSPYAKRIGIYAGDWSKAMVSSGLDKKYSH